jgi:hypothetical protein
VEEVLGFISKIEEAKVKGLELKGLSYKQVCQKIGYTPSHKVGEVLKKFFWKRYTESRRNATKLLFAPSCLITYPTGPDKKVDISSPEAVNDKSRVYDFTEEEARVWLEVLKIRHGEERAKQLIEALELDKVPVFKRVFNSISKQPELLIQEKPQKDTDSKGKVVPISEAVKQSKADKQETKQTEQEAKRSKEDTPFSKSILKKQAEPTYTYPENNNEDETIAGLMAWEEEREWIRENLRPIDDDFLENF